MIKMLCAKLRCVLKIDELRKNELAREMNRQLLVWAKQIIFAQIVAEKKIDEKEVYKSQLNDWNWDFWRQPDSVEHHEKKWHQFGIVTHTQKVWECYNDEMWAYLQKWEMDSRVKKILDEKLGDKSKDWLFQIAIWLHDVGKFNARKATYDGVEWRHSFLGHEKQSGILVRTKLIRNFLEGEYGLDEQQVEYVASLAEKHFELGMVRNYAKKSDYSFSEEFVNSKIGSEKLWQIIEQNGDLAWEIGIFYLIDSLGKMEFRLDENETIDEKFIQNMVLAKRCDENLVVAVKQLPVNLLLARKYLDLLGK